MRDLVSHYEDPREAAIAIVTGKVTDMQIEPLANEISKDPLGRGYNSMSKQQVAASLNEVNRSVVKPVPAKRLLTWATGVSALGKTRRRRIKEAHATHMSETVQDIAETALDLLESAKNDADLAIDTQDPNQLALVDALVSGGVLDPSDKQSLIDFASVPVSRATELGWPTIDSVDVRQARLYLGV